jgi:creatinine amidohydrolase
MRLATWNAQLSRAVFVVLAQISLAETALGQTPPAAAVTGARLEDLTWVAAEQRLTGDAVVVIPLGAAAQEHGPHLRMRHDLTVAEYLTRRLTDTSNIVAAPALSYHFYPAFAEYPGSTSLSLNTARDMTADVVRSIARHGPRRFYVLNTGYSTAPPLAAAAKVLANEGILLHYTDWRMRMGAWRTMLQQSGGEHADEAETSMMLYIDPAAVTMTAAARDYSPAVTNPFQLTRRQGANGTYSPTGTWGDPTLATRDKGRVIVEGLVTTLRGEIEELRRATPPTTTGTGPGGTSPAAPPVRTSTLAEGDCDPGDVRTIRAIGSAFTLAWSNHDLITLVGLWNPGGDMAHPDGLVESTRQTIGENRAYLFAQREYRGSKHFLSIGTIRCITPDIAIADAKWDLRGVTDAANQPVPPIEGLCTLVLKRRPFGWGIEAWRYNIKPSIAPTPPTLLKRPGIVPPIIK